MRVTTIDEIANDVFRISVYVPDINLQFNHFLVRDDEPLLYHTGLRHMFPLISEAVATLIKPSKIRKIGFSHFEVDECGALNEWLQIAPSAEPICSICCAGVNLSDFSKRPPKGLASGDVFQTGKYRFRFCSTPHLPHGWDASVLFEETQKTLFCSDLFHQNGNVAALTGDDVIERSRNSLIEYQGGPLMDYQPYTPKTRSLLYELAALKPETLAIMHGSSYTGDGEKALQDLAIVMKEVYGEKQYVENHQQLQERG
jgi:flavorubredoxin